MQLSQKQLFPNTSLHFWNLDFVLNIFKKKMILIADVFLKLPTPKNVIIKMSEKSRLRGPFSNQHGKRTQTLFNI